MRTRNIIIGAVVLLLAGGLTYWRLSRPRLSPEEQIRALIVRGEKAIERKDVGDIMGCVSADYHDAVGLTNLDIRRVAVGLARSPAAVEVDLRELRLEVHGSEGVVHAVVHLYITGEQNREVQGAVDLQVRRERGGWKVVSSDGWQGWTEQAL
jgi:hypothetical protein